MLLAPLVDALMGFTAGPAMPRTSSMPTLRTPAAGPHMDVYSTLASPMRKFEVAPTDAAAASGNMFSDLPVEVALLFGAIVVVGIAGLVKSSGALSPSAPTVGLGESRDEKVEEAAKAEAEMSQAEKERKYFAILADEQATKRGGSKSKRKKKK